MPRSNPFIFYLYRISHNSTNGSLLIRRQHFNTASNSRGDLPYLLLDGCTTRPKITRFWCRQLLDGGSNFACSFVTRPIKLTALFIASRHTSTLCYQDHKQLKNIKSLLLKRGGSHSFLEATGPVYSAEQHKLQKLVRHFSNC
jgi:hypothetical protein